MDQRWRRNHDLPNAARGPHLSQDPSFAFQQLCGEVHWLRNQLALARRHQSDCARRADSKLDERVRELTGQLQEQIEQHQLQTQELEAQLVTIESTRQERDQLQLQVKQLKHELANVAVAACEEQQTLVGRHEKVLEKAQRDQKADENEIRTLKSKLSEEENEVARLRSALSELSDRFDDGEQRLRASHAERDKLLSLVEILRKDHEVVEMVCADLDHHCDRLACEAENLRDSVVSATNATERERQQARRATSALEGQLETVAQELRFIQEEQHRTVEALTERESICDERNALLFAKDQEISASLKRMADLERQLSDSRQELQASHETIESLQDQLRCQTVACASLKSELEETRLELSDRDDVINEQDERLRMVGMAAREAEANAVKCAGEMERQFAEQCHRFREELTKERAAVETLSGQRALWEAERTQLEQTLSAAQTVAQNSVVDSGRARKELIGMREELERQRALFERESERADQLERLGEQLNEQQSAMQESLDRQTEQRDVLQSQAKEQANRIDQLTRCLQECELELQRVRQAATEAEQHLQEGHETFEQRLAHEKLLLRERHDQIASAQRLQIERLEVQIHRLAGDRESFHAQIAQLQQRLENVEPPPPISEARRLSRELARLRETHARERSFLYQRMEQLRTANGRLAA